MKALIFAAGLGTRLRPLTDTMPKAMVPVAGKPLLGHVLERLVSSLASCPCPSGSSSPCPSGENGLGTVDRLTEAVVNVHHFPDQIISYLASRDWGVPVRVSDERDFLRDTGGGLLYAEPLLQRCPSVSGHGPVVSDRILVHNVDILSNLDFRWLLAQAPADALSTLVVSERPTQRYFLFREEDSGLRLVGWTHVATGEVRTPFPDLDVTSCRKLAFAGIHLVSPQIFEAFRSLGFASAGDPPVPGAAPSASAAPRKFSITDFYLAACARYPIYGVVPPDFRMMDVGKVDTLAAAETFLAESLRTF
ncbi:MAG: NTP transferase domain-containing protein [Bacteroidales bacterium]|nr:NTP transferase domain-containing protein [Bacteroidales bacterium]